jgi:hypothetical protein
VALTALALVAGFTGGARADITYTWDPSHGFNNSGYLTVTDAAEQAGAITLATVVAFSFTDNNGNDNQTWTTSNLSPSLDIAISTTTGDPTGGPGSNITANNGSQPLSLKLDADWNQSGMESWVTNQNYGYGSWTITQTTAVPEPSSLAVAAAATLCGLTYAGVRRRRTS